MTDELLPAQIRRLSLYRQLSDALKSKRKSFCHVSSPPPLPPPVSSNSTFAWDCPSKSDSTKLVKQKSISYDDVAFLSNNEESSPAQPQTIVDEQSKQNGLAFFQRNINEREIGNEFIVFFLL